MSIEKNHLPHPSKPANQTPKSFKRPIWINLIILTFPIAIYLLFQQLSVYIDFYIIGNQPNSSTNLDKTISYMAQIKKILQSVAIALGGAGVILVAREYKKKNFTKAKQYATLAFLLAIISSLFFLVVFGLGVLLPAPFGDIFLNKSYHSQNGLTYYYLILITFVAITMNAVFIGLERAKEKTRFVLILNICLIITRISISFAFKAIKQNQVNLIDLALADLIANLLLTLVTFYCMFSSKNIFKLQFKNLVFSKRTVKTILKLAVTLIIAKSTYEIGKLIILAMIDSYFTKDQENLVDIFGFVMAVNGIFYAISNSFEDSQSAMVSQSVTFQSNSKTFKIFKNVVVITLIIGIIGVFINQFCGEQLLLALKPEKVFTTQKITSFKEILNWEQTSLFFSVWTTLMMGYVASYKKNANLIFVINLLRVVLRIIILWFLHDILPQLKDVSIPDATQCGLSTFGSNIIVFLTTTYLFVSFLRQNKTNQTPRFKKNKNNALQTKIIK
ncbi:MATE family efflux transporter [Chrysanthemum yellows phytoplasma]|uniref:MATE family efflux transporter n=1 Tax=Chrysanthemum yellows phytoplasma TaxID=238674 RepID=UPI00054CB6BC|nr:MATE family efflux transporter [Chrysanthemum yellows phytoplasma]PWV43867.1 MAG: sodium transporter ['Brassica napus' phytoplasma]